MDGVCELFIATSDALYVQPQQRESNIFVVIFFVILRAQTWYYSVNQYIKHILKEKAFSYVPIYLFS